MNTASEGNAQTNNAIYSLVRQTVIFSWFRKRIDKWLDKMAPAAASHTLTRKNVYIFPNLRGFGFLVVTAVLWLIGTNYQNNLVLAAAFFMAALFVISMLHTYLNLKGLQISAKGGAPVFAGETAHFVVKLNNVTGRQFENVQLFWQGNPIGEAATSVGANESETVEVALPAFKRGWLKPGRLCAQTDYPLGLLRCWTWLNLECSVLIYPKPLEIPAPESSALEGDLEAEHPIKGGEDFSGLDRYRPGDSLRNIAWKASAKGKGLFVKEYSQNESKEIWLDFYSAQASGIENKLSGLCYWAMEFDKTNENYGLSLPNVKVEPSVGDAHTERVLKALAEFNFDFPQESVRR